jgi:4-hydroxy-tetrahydrodipicolinate reductase
MIRVGVLGAYGRLGSSLCQGLEEAADIELISKVGSRDSLAEIDNSRLDVVIDASTTAAAEKNIPLIADMGLNVVVGVSGLQHATLQEFDQIYRNKGKTCLVVPNFAVSAVLAMRFAELAAPYFNNVEIIELHHNKKRDAPSGMASSTADRIAAARHVAWESDATDNPDGQLFRGGLSSGIHVHSVRLPGLVAHQDVIFGGVAQTLTIRYDTFDRAAFAPGAVAAVRSIARMRPGVIVGLDKVIDLADPGSATAGKPAQ